MQFICLPFDMAVIYQSTLVLFFDNGSDLVDGTDIVNSSGFFFFKCIYIIGILILLQSHKYCRQMKLVF